MSKIPYTNKQIEVANILRSVSSKGVPSDIVDEIINIIGEAEQKSIAPALPKEDTETTLKLKLQNEPDWKKRASLAAMIISKNLE